jgi:hypothetical protein
MLANLSSRKRTSLAVFLVACVAMPARGEESAPSYYVIAVGVNKYKHGSQLSSSVNDARKIAEFYRGQGARVTKVLTDEDATAKNIRIALSSAGYDRLGRGSVEGGEMRPGETLVLYFSGHGIRGQEFWSFVPYDFDGVMPGNIPQGNGPNRSNTSLISDVNILSCASHAVRKGHRVILIIDSCFAGQIRHNLAWDVCIGSSPDGSLGVQEEMQKGEFILLASSIPSQTSFAGAEYSRFTQAFLEAVSGKADLNGDKRVTLREVNDYLSERLWALQKQAFKYPGIAWVEQNHLLYATQAVSENLLLGRVVNDPSKQQNLGQTVSWGFRAGKGEKVDIQPPIGQWEQKKILRGFDGKEYVETYSLTLAPNGTYLAKVVDERGSIIQGNVGAYHSSGSSCMMLNYSNGRDKVHFDSVSDDEMTITMYPGEKTQDSGLGRARTLVLRRVKSPQNSNSPAKGI